MLSLRRRSKTKTNGIKNMERKENLVRSARFEKSDAKAVEYDDDFDLQVMEEIDETIDSINSSQGEGDDPLMGSKLGGGYDPLMGSKIGGGHDPLMGTTVRGIS